MYSGEVIGAYRLTYALAAGQNVSNVYAADVNECGRAPDYWSTSALEWSAPLRLRAEEGVALCGRSLQTARVCHRFCLYVQYSAGRSLGNCEGFAQCRFAGHCTPIPPALAL